MKNLYTSFLIIFITIMLINPITINAQNFAPLGAKWTFSEYNQGNNKYYPYEMEVIRLDNKLGQTTSVIKDKSGDWIKQVTGIDEVHVYEKDGKVYHFSPSQNRFLLMYDFNLEKGDTLFFESTSFEGTQFGKGCSIVKEVNYDTICGTRVKKLILQNPLDPCYEDDPNNTPINLTGELIEGVGIDYILPHYALVHTPGEIRCYESPDNNCKFVDYPCDTVLFTLANNKILKIKEFNIYSDGLNLNVSYKSKKQSSYLFTLYDLFGSIVNTKSLNKREGKFIIYSTLPGIYVWHLSNSSGQYISGKITN